MTHDPATLAQIKAANPRTSTWLSANAGSGKTRVLINRVAHLLLEGTPPERILCLTYTKAAANEMQNRLFANLGRWAMLREPELYDALNALGISEHENQPSLHRVARTMFARAIETPGGIKIQTIHAFCAALLRRFPLEAGISPNFVELDEAMSAQIQQEILEDIAQKHSSLAAFLARNPEQDLDKLLPHIVKQQTTFDAINSKADLARAFNHDPEKASDHALIATCFANISEDFIAQTIELLRAAPQKTMTKLAGLLENINFKAPDHSALEACIDALLTQKGTIPDKIPVKSLATDAPETFDRIKAFQARLMEAKKTLQLHDAFERNIAFYDFAQDFLRLYRHRKSLHRWMDFDDLILSAQKLLSKSESAAWVLYRLDGGIDHILLDEAQDTAPAQWDIIRLLTAEITAGLGSRATTGRSLFVVGDPKQSIYSFQGAEPTSFTEMQRLFHDALEQAGRRIENHKLRHSFRSAPAILDVIEKSFSEIPELSGADHCAFKENLPGRVELWPLIEANKEEEPLHWSTPVDMVSPQSATVQLAEKIAARIQTLLGQSIFDENGLERTILPSDILILTRKRKALFYEIIRACKARKLPMAGADRLDVMEEMAVKDLVALLKFLALPDDDLSLAVALRSPLFGLDEAALFDIAATRNKMRLFQALSLRRKRYTDAVRVLDDLLSVVDFMRPYELLQRILIEHDGRRNILARLGPEAEDGIDAILGLALNFEQQNLPNLDDFLSWLEVSNSKVKRQFPSDSGLIRIMTVHGAKGLEAPIVILPETHKQKREHRDPVLSLSGTALKKTAKITALKPPSDGMPELLEIAKDDELTLTEKERERLLYVAMTRAEQWLIIAGAGEITDQSWYKTAERGLKAVGAKQLEVGLCHENGQWPGNGVASHPSKPSAQNPLSLPAHKKGKAVPSWLFEPAPPAALTKTIPLNPSKLGGAKALAEENTQERREQSLERGAFFHKALEILAQENSSEAQEALIYHAPYTLRAEAEKLVKDAVALIKAPELAYLFSTKAFAEIPLAQWIGTQLYSGVIDRLLIEPTRIFAVDFKTNRTVPKTVDQTPLGFLRQMGAYRLMLKKLYPEKHVEVAILWTETRTVMTLPDTLLDQSFADIP